MDTLRYQERICHSEAGREQYLSNRIRVELQEWRWSAESDPLRGHWVPVGWCLEMETSLEAFARVSGTPASETGLEEAEGR